MWYSWTQDYLNAAAAFFYIKCIKSLSTYFLLHVFLLADSKSINVWVMPCLNNEQTDKDLSFKPLKRSFKDLLNAVSHEELAPSNATHFWDVRRYHLEASDVQQKFICFRNLRKELWHEAKKNVDLLFKLTKLVLWQAAYNISIDSTWEQGLQ